MKEVLAAAFLDRDSERFDLDRLLDEVRAGRSAVLVLRGEAGIGKTALLHYAARQASDFRIIQVAGVQGEMELPFAGLHQLCAPILAGLDRLPAPQRDALRVALGLASGDPPDRFLISLAGLGMLSAVAEERPLLCLVDDAQWLDEASAQVLVFVARRLAAESVALVFAVRNSAGAGRLKGLPELEVRGLDARDARALLSRAVPGLLDARVRDRVVAETGGNPLALLELPRGLSAAELASGVEIPVLTDLPERLEDLYLRRISALPAATQRLILLAAADPVAEAALVWRAASELAIAPDALLPAEKAGLVEVGSHVRFSHPLVRSAIYRAATPAERRSVHRALAGTTDAHLDVDRRAWHRAAAADGPDEDVASELERSADRARARGGLAAAAAFLRRSVALTSDRERRTERALAAAQASLQAGAFDAARAMLSQAETPAPDALQAARVGLLHGQIAFAEGLGSDAPPLLLAAARQLEPLDLDLARETYLNACGSAMFAGPTSAHHLVAAGRAVRALPPPTGTPRAVDILLDGIALLVTDGRAAAAPTLLRASRAFCGHDVPVEDSLRWGWFASAASNALWDDDGLRAVCAHQIQLARDAGALGQLPLHLLALSTAAARSGDLASAESLMAEAGVITEATGARLAPYTRLVVLALRGDRADAEALIDATIDQAADLRQGLARTVAQWAAAMLYNGLALHDDAFEAAAAASSTPLDMFPAMWALPELVEAAARTGAAEVAHEAVERLAETTRPVGSDFGRGIEARSRALVSEGAHADALYREAIERLARTRLRPDLARGHLVYGEWLRREDRLGDAREHLRTARGMLSDMGINAFAERAGRELVAIGEAVPKRRIETRDELSAQEREIARLARDGLSNIEIGARLFLSPRTVEWHLSKVFAKLGIRSRNGLAGALPDTHGGTSS